MREGPRTPSGCQREHGSGQASRAVEDEAVVVAGTRGHLARPDAVARVGQGVIVASRRTATERAFGAQTPKLDPPGRERNGAELRVSWRVDTRDGTDER